MNDGRLTAEQIEELERLESKALAAGEAFDREGTNAAMHAGIEAMQRFHDRLHENPKALLSAARLSLRIREWYERDGSVGGLAEIMGEVKRE